jgi:hypothetical protein
MRYGAGGLEGRERPSKGLQRKDATGRSVLERHRGEAPVEYVISQVQSDLRNDVLSFRYPVVTIVLITPITSMKRLPNGKYHCQGIGGSAAVRRVQHGAGRPTGGPMAAVLSSSNGMIGIGDPTYVKE